MSERGNKENARITQHQQANDSGYTREPEFTVSHVIHKTKYGSEVLQGMKTMITKVKEDQGILLKEFPRTMTDRKKRGAQKNKVQYNNMRRGRVERLAGDEGGAGKSPWSATLPRGALQTGGQED